MISGVWCQAAYLDARVSHEPRYADIGPSLTFAINAAPSKSTEKVNATRFRHMPVAFSSSFCLPVGVIFPRDCSRAKMIREHGRDDQMAWGQFSLR